MIKPDASFINGLNGSTGQRIESLTDQEILQRFDGIHPVRPPDAAKALEFIEPVHRDELDIAALGWGIIFAEAEGKRVAQIRDALSPLLALRRSQTELYREFGDGREWGWLGYPSALPRTILSLAALFLDKNGVKDGDPIEPSKVPFYLLIVGSPEDVPYDFQMGLSVDYAVGRIHFETLVEYENYAKSVVSAYHAEQARDRTATFFGTSNGSDPVTKHSAQELVIPLADQIADSNGDGPTSWQINKMIGAGQTEIGRLASVLGGSQTPTLLFSATHGMGFNQDDPRQAAHTGALLGQEWDLVQTSAGWVDESAYFSADDLADDANLLGSMVFLFACFSAGSPKMDQFRQIAGNAKQIAEKPFLARLPQKLLSHENGGALAVIGHVERVWTSSFKYSDPASSISINALGPFERTLSSLMNGRSIGAAFRPFPDRQDTFADRIATIEKQRRTRQPVHEAGSVHYWRSYNDARHYIIIGDPAVRLNLQ